MKRLPEEVIRFFNNQGFTIVSTIDKSGSPHNSCKGLVKIEPSGRIYLLDVYRAKTFDNLKNNPNASVTAVDEHKFKGYCLKGKAKAIEVDSLESDLLKRWEDKITGRVAQRVLRNIRGEKGHSLHPEAQLPRPQYIIYLEVEEIVDLTPHKLK